MKILYAVQATGNGHISRARIMAKNFAEQGHQVDWIFSGRKKEQLFDMQEFSNYRVFDGLTFVINNGRINYLATLFKNNLFSFIKDVFSLKLDSYDLILNDFEPVCAWAAKIKKIKCIGISNQMSLKKMLQQKNQKGNFLAVMILKYFAPASLPIGLDWRQSESKILPPIIDIEMVVNNQSEKEVLVYFPFCSAEKLIEWFADFKDYNFHIFHGSNSKTEYEHINFYQFSKEHFHQKQKICGGVITAAGFELASEAIHMGHKLLIIPLENQIEQQSNAIVLEQMKRAMVLHHFNNEELKKWLMSPLMKAKPYPNVACELVKWIGNSEKESIEKLSSRLWAEGKINK